MKVTLPDGTTVEGTYEEVKSWLPPTPPRNWDGSPKITCGATDPSVFGGFHIGDNGEIIPNANDTGYAPGERGDGGEHVADGRPWDLCAAFAKFKEENDYNPERDMKKATSRKSRHTKK